MAARNFGDADWDPQSAALFQMWRSHMKDVLKEITTPQWRYEDMLGREVSNNHPDSLPEIAKIVRTKYNQDSTVESALREFVNRMFYSGKINLREFEVWRENYSLFSSKQSEKYFEQAKPEIERFFAHVNAERAKLGAIPEVKYKNPAVGHRFLHKVSVPADTGTNYLHEKERLTEEQAGIFARILDRVGVDGAESVEEWKQKFVHNGKYKTCGDAYKTLAHYLDGWMDGRDWAGDLLSEEGIVGIRYEGFRDGKCAVIFDESNVRVKSVEKFSISKRAEEGYLAQLAKRKDYTPEEMEKAKNFLETLKAADEDHTKFVLVATKWIKDGKIRLPEDELLVREAIDLSQRKHIDPMQYKSPLDLIIKNKYLVENKNRLSPDDPQFQDVFYGKREEDGCTVYDVEDSPDGQQAVIDILRTHLAKGVNSPWCLSTWLANGQPTDSALHFWGHYGDVGRKIAFKNGKVFAFWSQQAIYAETAGCWWDLTDSSYHTLAECEDVPEIYGGAGIMTRRQGNVQTTFNADGGKVKVLERETKLKDGVKVETFGEDVREVYTKRGNEEVVEHYKNVKPVPWVEAEEKLSWRLVRENGVPVHSQEYGKRGLAREFDYKTNTETKYYAGGGKNTETTWHGETAEIKHFGVNEKVSWIEWRFGDAQIGVCEKGILSKDRNVRRVEFGSQLKLISSRQYPNFDFDSLELNKDGNAFVRKDGKPITQEDLGKERENWDGELYSAARRRVSEISAPSKPTTTRDEAKKRIVAIRGKDLLNHVDGSIAQINAAQQGKLLSKEALAKSLQEGFTKEQHYFAVSVIDKLWANAVLYFSHGDTKAENKNTRINRYISPIIFGGKIDYAFLTAKESVVGGKKIYSVELDKLGTLRGKVAGFSSANLDKGVVYYARNADEILAEIDESVKPWLDSTDSTGIDENRGGNEQYSASRERYDKNRAILAATEAENAEIAELNRTITNLDSMSKIAQQATCLAAWRVKQERDELPKWVVDKYTKDMTAIERKITLERAALVVDVAKASGKPYSAELIREAYRSLIGTQRFEQAVEARQEQSVLHMQARLKYERPERGDIAKIPAKEQKIIRDKMRNVLELSTHKEDLALAEREINEAAEEVDEEEKKPKSEKERKEKEKQTAEEKKRIVEAAAVDARSLAKEVAQLVASKTLAGTAFDSFKADEVGAWFDEFFKSLFSCSENTKLQEELAVARTIWERGATARADAEAIEIPFSPALQTLVWQMRDGMSVEETGISKTSAKVKNEFKNFVKQVGDGEALTAEQKMVLEAAEALYGDEVEVWKAEAKPAEGGERYSLEGFDFGKVDLVQKPSGELVLEETENGGKSMLLLEQRKWKMLQQKVKKARDLLTDEVFKNEIQTILPATNVGVDFIDGREILLKQAVIHKNNLHHPEVSPEESREILSSALYAPVEVFQGKPTAKPNYYVFARLQNGSNAIVNVDTDSSKKHIEVVGWWKINNERLNALRKRAKKEGGQFLITNARGERAAVLSALQLGSEGILADGNAESKRYSVEQERDAEYLAAVERGDLDTAQDMVNAEAARKGYTFHRGKNPKDSPYIVEFADDSGEITGYGEHQFAVKSERLMDVDEFVDKNPDVQEFLVEYAQDNSIETIRMAVENSPLLAEAEEKGWEIEYFDGGGYVHIPTGVKEMKEAMSPTDIVASAELWDDANFVNEFWQRFEDKFLDIIEKKGIAGFKTPNGAVVFPGTETYKIADAVTRDDNGNVIPLSQRFNDSVGDVRYSIEQDYEMSEIRERAIAAGTFMKAPNGAPTKLNEQQWLQVWTNAFKFGHFVDDKFSGSFFGAWDLKHKSVNIVEAEANAPFNNKKDALAWAESNGIVGLMSNEETGGKGEIHISKSSIDESLNPKQRAKSVSQEAHYAALMKLRDIIRESTITDVHADYKKGEDKKRSVNNETNPSVGIMILHGSIRVGGETYRVKTTLKQYAPREKKATKAYAYEVSEIEVLGVSSERSKALHRPDTSIPLSILLDGVRNVNGELTLEDYSKVLDENGEPKVVYNGSGEQFDAFDISIGRENEDVQAAYFTPNKMEAEDYGENVQAFFLNIRHPAPQDYAYKVFAEGKREKRGVRAREQLVKEGYDGIIRKDDDGNVEEYVSFDAKKIKSATDNNGDFDTRNDKFRYSLFEPRYDEERASLEGAMSMNFQVRALNATVANINSLRKIGQKAVNLACWLVRNEVKLFLRRISGTEKFVKFVFLKKSALVCNKICDCL